VFLDYGCGTGVFTELLQTVLPGWRACGADIVENALDKARNRCPTAAFCHLDGLANQQFDLVFSHHVLEHVQNLEVTVSRLAELTAPGSVMVCIMPCGNADSLEHGICSARRGGIDADSANRFFFEDEGHLRRLSAAELGAMASRHGFRLRDQLFANHYYGALKWLTDQSPEWLRGVLDPAAAVDAQARLWLTRLRRRVLWLRFLRRPPSLLVPGMEWRLQKRERSILETGALILSNPVTIFSGVVDRWLQRADEREWRSRRYDDRGSEMYLVFMRDDVSTNAFDS
jgi:SAM-dependent methyltransferase